MKHGTAKNRSIIIIVVAALVIIAVEAGALYKMVRMILHGESPRQLQAQASAGPLDLSGEWVQTNSASKDSYQAVSITEQTIDVYWISESEGIYMLYWSGTYEPPAAPGDTYHWTSQNDTARTSTSRRGSQETEKEFSYLDGKLTYQAESGSEVLSIEAEPRTWSYSTAVPASGPQEAGTQQGEEYERHGDIGDYHIEISGAKAVEDVDGNPAVIVTYTWTNNSEATASAMVMLQERAYQGDVQLTPDQSTVWPGYDARSAAQNVPPGGTATVQRAYLLTGEDETLTFAVTEFLSHTKNAVVGRFDLTEQPSA